MLRCNRAWDKVDSFRSPLGYYIIQNAFSGVLHLTPEFFKMKDFIFIFDNSVWAIAGAYLPRAYLHIQNITKASYDLLTFVYECISNNQVFTPESFWCILHRHIIFSGIFGRF